MLLLLLAMMLAGQIDGMLLWNQIVLQVPKVEYDCGLTQSTTSTKASVSINEFINTANLHHSQTYIDDTTTTTTTTAICGT